MNAEMKNAPLLAGWAIAAGVGAVACGVAFFVGHLGAMASIAAAVVLFLLVGIILGLPRENRGAVAISAPPVDTWDTPATEKSTAPAAAVSFVSASAVSERRPEALSGPRGGKPDDLKIIEGIGPKLEELCHSLGFYHFDQIANWTADEIAWVDSNLAGFRGRVSRDKWVAQAKLILSVGIEDFLRRAKTNDY